MSAENIWNSARCSDLVHCATELDLRIRVFLFDLRFRRSLSTLHRDLCFLRRDAERLEMFYAG